MTNGFETPKTSLISRTLCSIAWVVITCWLGFVNLFFLLMISTSSQWQFGGIIWIVANLLLCSLLLWWTGRAYPAWKSWRFGLILQFCLVAISMLNAYPLLGGSQIFVAGRPLALLFPLRLYEDSNWLSFLLGYLIAFAEIAVWQALAICLRHISDKRKANKPIQPSAPPVRKDEW